jgi:hypothetical protein
MPNPKQKKSESKQDYLRRCTEQRIADGENIRSAYAKCAAVALGEDKNAMFLTAPLELNVTDEKKRTFIMTAKTGTPVDRWGYKIAIDIKGIRTETRIPVLRQHEHDRIVGHGASFKDGENLFVEGEFSQSTVDAAEVLALADEGYPWQSSIGIWAEAVKFLDDGVKYKVNGLEIEGPAEIWTKSYVREASFVTLGADSDTAAIALAKKKDPDKDHQSSIQAKETKAMELTIEKLKTDHPDLWAELETMSADKVAKAMNDGIEQGTQAERTRVVTLLDSGADDDAVRKSITEGTEPNEAFKMFFEAEKQKRVDTLATLAENAPDTMGQDRTQNDGPRPFLDLVNEYKAEKGCSKAEAMKVIAAKYPESHQAFIKK